MIGIVEAEPKYPVPVIGDAQATPKVLTLELVMVESVVARELL